MPTHIVTSTYRYKRPPRKKKPVLLEVPAIVTKRAPHSPQAGAPKPPAPANDDRKPANVTMTEDVATSAHVSRRSQPAADAPRPPIVTARRPGAKPSVEVPDMTLAGTNELAFW